MVLKMFSLDERDAWEHEKSNYQALSKTGRVAVLHDVITDDRLGYGLVLEKGLCSLSARLMNQHEQFPCLCV